MVLQNLQAIGNSVVARFDSLDKVLIEFLTFTVQAVVIFRVVGAVVDVHSLLLGVIRPVANMTNKNGIAWQGTPQGLSELTQTGQLSKQDNFLNSPYPDLGGISGQHESELRRANTRYLNSAASAEGMQGKLVREFASDRPSGWVPNVSGGIQHKVGEGPLSMIAKGF